MTNTFHVFMSMRSNGCVVQNVLMAVKARVTCTMRSRGNAHRILTSRHTRFVQDLREICVGFVLYPNITPRRTKSEPSRCATRRKPPFLRVWTSIDAGQSRARTRSHVSRRTFESDQSSCARARAESGLARSRSREFV